MNTERLIKFTLMELSAEGLKLEDELERIVNGDFDITYKSQEIRNILSQMVAVDASIAKFTGMMTNNNKLNQENDGKN